MDSDWLGRLVDQHAAALELFARQRCDTPEDVVQEACVTLAAQGTLPANPVAWLFRLVRNGAINAAEDARRRRRHESEAAAGSIGWFQAEFASMALDPDTAAAELKSLPPEQREVIVAHLWCGLTFEQFAVVSGSSASSAHCFIERVCPRFANGWG